MNLNAISSLAVGLAASGLSALGLRLYWRLRWGPPAPGSIPVLAYHKVDPGFELGGTRISPARFARQMRWLRDNGYRTVTATKAAELMAQKGSGGEKLVCITFDDAYQGVYDHALPALMENGFTATVFVITDYVGADNRWDVNWGGLRFPHLDWGRLREMQDAGIEIGSHSASHRDLRFLDDGELASEVAGSKLALEERLGAPVRAFSYPFGRYDGRAKRTAAEAGYGSAWSMSPRARNSVFDPFALRRCGVYVTDTLWDLRHKVEENSSWFWLQDLWSRAVNFCAGGTSMAQRLFMRRKPKPK